MTNSILYQLLPKVWMASFSWQKKKKIHKYSFYGKFTPFSEAYFQIVSYDQDYLRTNIWPNFYYEIWHQNAISQNEYPNCFKVAIHGRVYLTGLPVQSNFTIYSVYIAQLCRFLILNFLRHPKQFWYCLPVCIILAGSTWYISPIWTR